MNRLAFRALSGSTNTFVADSNVGRHSVVKSGNRADHVWLAYHDGALIASTAKTRLAAEAQCQEHFVTMSQNNTSASVDATTVAAPKAPKAKVAKATSAPAPAEVAQDAPGQAEALAESGDSPEATSSVVETTPEKPAPTPKTPVAVKVPTSQAYGLKAILDSEQPVTSSNMKDAAPALVAVHPHLQRRHLIHMPTEVDEPITLTAKGEVTLAAHDFPAPKPEKAKKQRDPNAPSAIVAKYGPRPDNVGDTPSRLEYAEARLENAEASAKFASVNRRLHPYSPIAERKEKSAYERVEIARANLEKVKASGTGEQSATPADEKAATEVATTTE